MLLTAGFIGGLSGLFSANISYMAPAMPTGPWMVVVLSLVFAVSFLFAPQRGLISSVLKQRRLRRQVCDENVLRTLYVLNERHPANRHHAQNALALDLPFAEEDILALRTMPLAELKETLARMKKHGWLTATDTVRAVALSPEGAERAVALTRRHRLWENYLTEQLDLTPDRVHSQAEQIEHLLTDEETRALERELQSDQNGSLKDPHGRRIPAAQVASEQKGDES
jgi:manganese/zinc/iron transport system permease protein